MSFLGIMRSFQQVFKTPPIFVFICVIDIFKKREMQPGVSIDKFLGDFKDKPEVVNKRLTD